MDHNVPSAITAGLRLRGVDVVTAFEDDHHEVDDSTLLDRASELERVLFTRDDDLIGEAHQRQREGIPFSGVIYAHQLRVSIGGVINDMELVAKIANSEDLEGQIEFLPL